MSLTRHFSLPAHGAIEFLIGISMMFAPAIFGFGAAGLVISAPLGAILTGVGLTLSTGPHVHALRWHTAFDSAFVLVTALAALGLALAADTPAAIFLATAVAVLAALHTATRYVTAS